MSVLSANPSERTSQLRLMIFVSLATIMVFLPYYLWLLDFDHPIPRDGTSLVVGRDFFNFWMYGRAAWQPDPGRLYDLATYQALTATITGENHPGLTWSYPPSVMLLAAPFGRMPYFLALALWTLIGPLVFTCAIRLWTRDWRVIAPIILAPAAIFGLMSGQFHYIAAAGILTFLRWRETRPILAGIILGFLTLKPQLGLLFPILLLATRNWRVIMVAAFTAVAIASATALIWGPDIWIDYIKVGVPTQSHVLSDPEKLGEPFMPTLFMNARTAGLSYSGAMLVQALGFLVAILLVWNTSRRRPDPTDLRANAIFLAALLFGTPYLLTYDTLPLAAMAVLLSVNHPQFRTPLTLLVYLLTLVQLVLGNLEIPGPALIPIAFAMLLARSFLNETTIRPADRPAAAFSAD